MAEIKTKREKLKNRSTVIR